MGKLGEALWLKEYKLSAERLFHTLQSTFKHYELCKESTDCLGLLHHHTERILLLYVIHYF